MIYETDLVKLLSYPWAVTVKEDIIYPYDLYNWVVKVLLKNELRTHIFYFESLPNSKGHDTPECAKKYFDLLRVHTDTNMDQILSGIHNKVSKWRK